MLDDELTKFKRTGDFLSFSLACMPFSLHHCPFKLIDSLNDLLNVVILTHGVLLIEPEDRKLTNKDIVLSCGIHGNETAPIEILNDLIQKIFTRQLPVKQRLLFIIGNLPAIQNGTRFIDENLNNLFAINNNAKQSINQNVEQQRAAEIEKQVNTFYAMGSCKDNMDNSVRERIHLDLHTAIRDSIYAKFAVYPIDDLSLIDHSLIMLLQESDVNTVLFSYQATKTFCYFTYKYCKAKSLTIELGKIKPFGENNLADFEEISRVLISLINNIDLKNSIEATSNIKMNREMTLAKMKFFEIYQRVYKQSKNFSFTFTDEAANFLSFNQGDLLAKDGENYYFAKENEEVILFPNKQVKIGQRALLTARPINIM